MSVEKVNQYKKEKAGRRETLQKQKKQARLIKAGVILGAVLALALIAGAIGVTIRNERKAYLASLPTYKTETMLVGDMAGVLQETPETEAGAEG